MLRLLYRCSLRLHPTGFRERFTAEMLSIFDQAAGTSAALGLVLDGLVSLVRQWTLRREFWHEMPPAPATQPAPDGIPSFQTIDPFRPRTAAVFHGVVLSTAVFCLTCFAIRYSWIHVLHVHIPEVQWESPRSIESNAGTGANAPMETASKTTRPEAESPIAPLAAPRTSSSEPVQPVAAETQDRVARNSVAHPSSAGSQPSQVNAAALPAVRDSRHSKPGLGAKSDKANNLQLNPLALPHGSGVAQLQTQQAEPQHATAANTAILAAVAVELDPAEKRRVIDGAIAKLTRYYVDPDVARKMSEALLAHAENGDDDTATDGETFADLLTTQMRDVSHDAYVTLVYAKVPTAENPPAPTKEEIARYRKEMERTNCSFEKVTILPHNIGYLKFNAFPDASICGSTAAAAMASLNHADAIIFDLRDNPGGYANMVTLIATYLFDRPTHLNDFYNRGDNSTEPSWTLQPVSGNLLADKPVFVLTSHSTFSAAEAFSYDLKMLKRATLVGETTSGRGHMGMGHRIDDHFTIRVPGIKVVNPISKANWEGTGVVPDIKVGAAEALETAKKIAMSKLQK